MPQIVILAGPNGAGKSTLAARSVPPGVPFLNTDNIARSLTPAPGWNVGIAAGRLLLAWIDEAVQTKISLAMETNLANRTLATRILHWQDAGYTVSLVSRRIPSADLAVERVAAVSIFLPPLLYSYRRFLSSERYKGTTSFPCELYTIGKYFLYEESIPVTMRDRNIFSTAGSGRTTASGNGMQNADAGGEAA